MNGLLAEVYRKWTDADPYTLTREFLEDIGSMVVNVSLCCADCSCEEIWDWEVEE